MPDTFILSTAYFPPVSYFNKLLIAKNVFIEAHENFTKQSYRNRCVIAAANGIQTLSIPVVKKHGQKVSIKEVEIDYAEDWQRLHFKAIESAYRNAPFYEYYIDDVEPFFKKRHKYLFDLNLEILESLLDTLEIQVKINHTTEYIAEYPDAPDYRNCIHPKKRMQQPDDFFKPKKYYQVFAEKNGFQPNLSILDLLFNEGPQSNNFIV